MVRDGDGEEGEEGKGWVEARAGGGDVYLVRVLRYGW